jgi:predicted ATP-grasp superfamily ATP-dependent carboligase
MHKRIRELYVMGGPSTCAESVYDSKLMDYGLRILKALKWHGVAMVEFKKDSTDGTFKLMEINPKFWGSLDLAIASSVNFPYLLYKMTIDGDVSPTFSYKNNVKFVWPFPDDLIHALNKPQDLKYFLSDLFNPCVNKNISINDLCPILFPVIKGISIVTSKFIGENR